MDNLEQLKIQRRVIKSQLTRFSTFFTAVKEERKTIEELKIRLESIDKLLQDYNDIQFEIEKITPDTDLDAINANDNDRETFENNYFAIMTEVRTYLNNINSSIINSAQETKQNYHRNLLNCQILMDVTRNGYLLKIFLCH